MEELPKCKYCNYSNSNLIELNNHNLTCYKKYINEILLKNSQIDNFVKSVKKRLSINFFLKTGIFRHY
jgi:hypothetical protein